MPESRADVHLGGEWTSTASGKGFFMAENGQGDDRLIVFAMFKTVHKTVRKVFHKSRRNTTFWSKVSETGVGKQGISRAVV